MGGATKSRSSSSHKRRKAPMASFVSRKSSPATGGVKHYDEDEIAEYWELRAKNNRETARKKLEDIVQKLWRLICVQHEGEYRAYLRCVLATFLRAAHASCATKPKPPPKKKSRSAPLLKLHQKVRAILNELCTNFNWRVDSNKPASRSRFPATGFRFAAPKRVADLLALAKRSQEVARAYGLRMRSCVNEYYGLAPITTPPLLFASELALLAAALPTPPMLRSVGSVLRMADEEFDDEEAAALYEGWRPFCAFLRGDGAGTAAAASAASGSAGAGEDADEGAAEEEDSDGSDDEATGCFAYRRADMHVADGYTGPATGGWKYREEDEEGCGADSDDDAFFAAALEEAKEKAAARHAAAAAAGAAGGGAGGGARAGAAAAGAATTSGGGAAAAAKPRKASATGAAAAGGGGAAAAPKPLSGTKRSREELALAKSAAAAAASDAAAAPTAASGTDEPGKTKEAVIAVKKGAAGSKKPRRNDDDDADAGEGYFCTCFRPFKTAAALAKHASKCMLAATIRGRRT